MDWAFCPGEVNRPLAAESMGVWSDVSDQEGNMKKWRLRLSTFTAIMFGVGILLLWMVDHWQLEQRNRELERIARQQAEQLQAIQDAERTNRLILQ